MENSIGDLECPYTGILDHEFQVEKENVKKIKEIGHTHKLKKIIKVDLQKAKTRPTGAGSFPFGRTREKLPTGVTL